MTKVNNHNLHRKQKYKDHFCKDKIKDAEKEIERLNKQNRKLYQDYATYKNATDMYKKHYEKLLEENKELKEKLEIVDKKIKKIDLSEWVEITYSENWNLLTQDFNMNCTLFVNKINEIIDYINEGEDENVK